MADYDKNSFLGSGYKRLDLKYIFDHLRNLGIAAAIFVVAMKTTEESVQELSAAVYLNPELMKLCLFATSTILLILNFCQLLYVAMSKGTRLAVLFWSLLSVPIYLITALLFIGFVNG